MILILQFFILLVLFLAPISAAVYMGVKAKREIKRAKKLLELTKTLGKIDLHMWTCFDEGDTHGHRILGQQKNQIQKQYDQIWAEQYGRV